MPDTVVYMSKRGLMTVDLPPIEMAYLHAWLRPPEDARLRFRWLEWYGTRDHRGEGAKGPSGG